MKRLKSKLHAFFWWIVQLAPVMFLLALHFVDFQALQSVIGDGTQFGLFGTYFVSFLHFFKPDLGLYQLMLISIVDWALSVTICRLVFLTFEIFTTWLYDLFDPKEKTK